MTWKTGAASALFVTLALVPLQGGQTAGSGAPPQTAAAQADQTVPADLQPLLTTPQGELRLVVQRYTADRATLNGNYQDGRGGGRGGPGGGRGDAPAATTAVNLSPNRIARLKRYDLDWQTALARLDPPTLSGASRNDLVALQATILGNLKQLDDNAGAIARIVPILPFAPRLVELLEARRRMDDVDSKGAAGILTDLAKQIRQLQGAMETTSVSKVLAVESADTADSLRSSLTVWFNFYNGYDPLFTWWMGMPFKQADEAMQKYAALLREKGAAADPTTSSPAEPAPAVAPAPAPKLNQVPDLRELMSLPHDEMTAVVQRFVGTAGGGRGATNNPGAGRRKEYYVHWLAALKTLDFDRLSRNAQVDYLFIRNASERQIARIEFTPDAVPPRKTDDTGIPGAARGRAGLVMDLGDEMIPYSPEDLLVLAEREYKWHEAEMKKASRAMGLGDDWKKAVEKVKDMHVAPGQQPGVVRDMLFEAVDYLRARDLVTVPQIASESFHMSMMSPEAQLSNPFFLGGNQIIVAYPTNTMEYAARVQSLRGNNIPFSHAVAFHEMIPGHNLVGFMGTRFATYRARIGGSTPFFGEGWPLYWELLMYELGFHDTPEERVGALFWRMHRCARIIFSLKFHMGEWSPRECIDFLVERVGHERDNATAEVRRSFQGGYGPLYQAAYLLGGLQLRGLRKELVDEGRMTNKQFHDEILRQGSMPIALLRLALGRQKLTRDMPIDWKFYGEIR